MKLPQKLGLGGAILSVFGLGFGWGIFPWFLNTQISKAKGLVPGSEGRGMWEKLPIPLDFKVYMFNVTNPNEVQKGELPVVDEIGPIWYDEWKEKVEIVDYEANDTVSFHMKNTWVFNKEKSAPFTGKEVIILPHPAMVGMIGTVEIMKPSALGMVNKAIPFLFNSPETIFLTTTVHQLLFEGIFINCTSKEFPAKAICTVLKKEGKDLVPVENQGFLFSIFGPKNGTADRNKFLVSRGIKDHRKVGEMVMLNGEPKLDLWLGDPCNELQGTDSTVFQPFFTPEMDMVSFSPDICRSLPAKFVRASEYKKIQTLRYDADMGDQSNNPQDKCYCISEDNCLKKGVMNLYKCTGAPLIASLPHFLNSHEDYQKGVRGLRPNEDEHAVIVELEPMTGSPVYAKKRLQFAFPIHPVNKVDLTTNLPTTILPFMWVEEGVELNDEFIGKIDGELFFIIRMVNYLRWFMTIGGFAIMGSGLGVFYKNQQNKLSVSPTTKKPEFLGDTKPSSGVGEGGNVNYGYI